MARRIISIWLRYLLTDWYTRRRPEFKNKPLVVCAPSHGRMIIVAVNNLAEVQGISTGMALADARAIITGLQVVEEEPGLSNKLLNGMAEWCIRFTPCVAVDPPDGIILDITGCAHLWGDEECYATTIIRRLEERGYTLRIGMADTIGAAWAVARFTSHPLCIVAPCKQADVLMTLPSEALRLETDTVERLYKLGLRYTGDFMSLSSTALRRRFGQALLTRLNQCLGVEEEHIEPIEPVEPFQERLACLEPIVTAAGITIALERLLETLCKRLQQSAQGLRLARFKAFRLDGRMEQIEITTNRPSSSVQHLFKLFEHKIVMIEPDLGIEVFVLEALRVEEHTPLQSTLWEATGGLSDIKLSELIDRIAGYNSSIKITRYLPSEHYWPERSYQQAGSLQEQSGVWKLNRPRPLQLLKEPHPVIVTAPVPDYPPMNFRYKGRLHTIKKADGPERIESEWWLRNGEHRDYYYVEDMDGCRYWIFRLGHYDAQRPVQWFIHGFFA